jgi:DNA-binding NarL/FixJ family response regulator
MQTERLGTVLIVDDTPANLAFLSDALDDAGYEVLVAPSGLTALRQLELIRPDVILLDAVMPGLDGFETCQRLKSQRETRDIPVIFMTALAATADIVRGLGEGADDYVTKPVREEEVLARIATHIARSRSLRRAHSTVEAPPRASFTVDGDGVLTWQSDRARSILPILGEPARLPLVLVDWLARCREEAGLGTRSTTLTIAGRRILVEYCGDVEGGEYLLFCEPADTATEEPLARAFGLTPRESEVLRWVTAGKTNRDIGMILGTSPRTVTKHLEHVFAKLGVETRTAAASRALAVLGAGA